MQQSRITSKYTESVTVLSVSPLEDDHTTLQLIIGHSRWKLFKADSHSAALSILRRDQISVVVCEHGLKLGKWTDLLDRLNDLQHPPSLIVTSRLADDRLWAEALNLGAWDVLAKPFDRTEVLRGVKAAWQHWHDQIQESGMQAMKAAS
jgi:DNA-binding response OmpR family regulator